jgi:ABC-type branched-subunit amino acid transport system substrate-binding protein
MKQQIYILSFCIIVLSVLTLSCTATVPSILPDEIPIGCVIATNSAPAWGPNLIKSAQIAISEINSHGGIDGKKLTLLIEDEGPTSASSLIAVHKLIDESKVQVIIGCTFSEAVMGAGQYFASKNIPLVTPSATSTALSQQRWSNWVFRISPDDSLQGGVVAKLIKDRGFKKVAILVQDTIYGRGIEDVAKEFLKGRAEIVISLRYDPSKLSYLTELNTIKDKKPDCVLHVGYLDDSAAIYRQALDSGMDNIKWLATDGSYDMPLNKYIEAAKFMEKAVTGTVPVPDKQSEAYKRFDNNYRLAYNFAPTIFCDTTYDGANVIALAIKKANTYAGTTFKDALVSIGKGYKGASGTITFDEQGSRIAGTYGIWKVEMRGTQYEYVMTGESVNFLKPKTN